MKSKDCAFPNLDSKRMYFVPFGVLEYPVFSDFLILVKAMYMADIRHNKNETSKLNVWLEPTAVIIRSENKDEICSRSMNAAGTELLVCIDVILNNYFFYYFMGFFNEFLKHLVGSYIRMIDREVYFDNRIVA